MFQYSKWMLVHPTHLVLSSEIVSNEIFYGSFLIKNHVVSQQQNEFHSAIRGTEKLQEVKAMLQYTMCIFVHLTHLVLSCATLLFEIFCGSFLIKKHGWSKIHTIHYLNIPSPVKLEHRIDPLSPLGERYYIINSQLHYIDHHRQTTTTPINTTSVLLH